MKDNFSDKDLQVLVFKHLTKVLKNNRKYFLFRSFIGHQDGSRRKSQTVYSLNQLRHPRSSEIDFKSDNPFYYALSMNDLFGILDSLLGGNKTRGMRYHIENDNAKIQQRVMQYLNTLLHHCLERGVEDVREVEEIGRTTFNMTCKKIFGNDFVDEMKGMSEEMEKELKANLMERLLANRSHNLGATYEINSERLAEFEAFLSRLGPRTINRIPEEDGINLPDWDSESF